MADEDGQRIGMAIGRPATTASAVVAAKPPQCMRTAVAWMTRTLDSLDRARARCSLASAAIRAKAVLLPFFAINSKFQRDCVADRFAPRNRVSKNLTAACSPPVAV
jgi:hypothetical protein